MQIIMVSIEKWAGKEKNGKKRALKIASGVTRKQTTR
jgi:hypothetical protein